MDFLDHFFSNHAHLYYAIAGICFVVELTVMGLSGPLLFFAIACFITGVLSSFGLITGWDIELFTLGILTTLITIVLWKPLKGFQNKGVGKDTSSDMIGLQVPCSKDINALGGAIRYSGINWTARLDIAYSDVIPEGTVCEITAVEGNVMIVKPKG